MAVGARRRVVGGMAITVVGNGFDDAGSSLYKCLFRPTPRSSQGPTGTKTDLNFLQVSDAAAESVPVIPLSSSRIVFTLPEWVHPGKIMAPSFTLTRLVSINSKGQPVPEFVCSGGDSQNTACISICVVTGCGGCVGGV